MEFYEAWDFLCNHEIYQDSKIGMSHFEERCLSIEVVKVNPKTEEIDDDESKNTSTRVWLESGPYNENYYTHDVDLDCGGKTFEEAIIALAENVKIYHSK